MSISYEAEYVGDLIYEDENWKLIRAMDEETEITQWLLVCKLGMTISWGWSEFPEEEELASTIKQVHSYLENKTSEIIFSCTFYAHLTPECFRIETGDSEFKLPAKIGDAFFKDLAASYCLE